ncbi:MAG: hypothetical protein IKI01_02275 [Lachnospiraceae bacterium]|nr:hypothetical protein [Lachnospiraceae bacterium]
MKRFLSFLLILAYVLSITGEKSYAGDTENMWNNTVNYENRSGYTDDQLVDREFFSTMIGVSNDYLVMPLYDLQNNVSAYIIQYYSEGVPLSYVVINTSILAEDAYYIEFGEGEFGRVVGLDKVESAEEMVQVCYCGGSQYYLLIDDDLYYYDGELKELADDIVEDLEERSCGDYYNFGETLTYLAVLEKEIGYDSVSSYSRSTSFTKRTTTSTKYAYGSNNPVSNHCAPTAGINLLQYLYSVEGKTNIPMSSWQSVFIALHTAMGTSNLNGTADSALAPAYQSVLRSYGYNSATASIQYSASWLQITSAINSNAVHLVLCSSEIYGDHSVVGLGYVSFTHSTGWVSKYYKIVDGWTADIRYVHSSLGIASINLVTVYVGS